MAMKETEGSLRAYFLVAGGLSTLSAQPPIARVV